MSAASSLGAPHLSCCLSSPDFHYIFLHTFFGIPAPSSLLRFHGAVMSGWILIYFIQAILVSVHRVAAHRMFGMFGAAYAALVVGSRTTATFLSARPQVRGHTDAVFSFLNVLGLELAQMFYLRP
jgi:hypothetical protein